MNRILCLFIAVSLSSTIVATTWTYTENETGPNKLALGYPVPLPIDSMLPVDGFRSYASLYARHQDLMILSDNVRGEIVGQTTYGRDIWAYALSDPDTLMDNGFQSEGAALQNGGIHAREWASPEVVTGIIERFAEQENDNWLHQYLLQNMNMVVIPVLNVDGFIQTQRYPNQALQSTFADDPNTWPRDGRFRRKNMRNTDELLLTESDALNGIDLNRNNNPYWASSNRSSNQIGSLVHHGSSAGSEPETKALYAAAELGPANQLRFYVDTHSFSKLWYLPNTSNNRRNAIADSVARRMRAATGNAYSVSPSPDGSGIGSTDEYFATTYQIPSYTLEIEPSSDGGTDYGGFGVSHSGFVLPESEITRVRNELADASIIAWYMQADAAHVKAVEISRTTDDTVVFAGHWESQSATRRTWRETTNDGLVANTTYRIWVAYNKPMRWLNEQGDIARFRSLSTFLPPLFDLEGIDAAGTAFETRFIGQNSDWLTNPGGPSQGYLQYKTDAFMFDFELTTGVDPTTASLLALAFENRDMAAMLSDANPATAVAYDQQWLNYESTDGSQEDTGGIDRSIRIIDDGSPAFTDPNAVIVTPPPTPPPTTSGGGGSMTPMLLIALSVLLFRRRLRYSLRFSRWM